MARHFPCLCAAECGDIVEYVFHTFFFSSKKAHAYELLEVKVQEHLPNPEEALYDVCMKSEWFKSGP